MTTRTILPRRSAFGSTSRQGKAVTLRSKMVSASGIDVLKRRTISHIVRLTGWMTMIDIAMAKVEIPIGSVQWWLCIDGQLIVKVSECGALWTLWAGRILRHYGAA